MSFDLPLWFTNWNKNKIIKVYNYNFNYLESQNKKPILSTLYQNQFISVHSNIAHNDTVTLHSKYADVLPNDYFSSPNESNSEIKEIRIQFRDACGKLIPIRTSYSADDDNTTQEEIQQGTFKIEIELAILE
jgi:hypothetical protein